MSQKPPTNYLDDIDHKKAMELARKQLYKSTPGLIIDSIAGHIVRIHQARRRIDKEGIVVRDLKGSVVPHPAIKIDIEATKLIADLFKKFE